MGKTQATQWQKVMVKTHQYHWVVVLLLFIGITLIWWLPWCATGKIYLGDDLGFHLNRVQGVYQSLKTGHLGLGHVATTTFGGWGYPINLFYPAYLLWPLAGLQVILGGVRGYVAFLFLVNLATLYSARFVGKRVLHSEFQGILVAVIYNFATYRLLDFFVRGALAESLTFIFIPLVFYGAYCIAYGDFHQWYWLAIGMALIGLTHIVSLMLSATLVLLTLGLFAWRRTDWRQRLLALGAATGTTCLLIVTFLAPLWEQLKATPISILRYSLQSSAEQPLIFFENSILNKLGSNQINVGWLSLVLLVLSLVCFRRLDHVLRYLTGLALVFTLMATQLFPWRWLQGIFGMIQFPWRFLAIATFLIAIVGARAVALLLTQPTWLKQTAVVGGIIILGGSLTSFGFARYAASSQSRSIPAATYESVATTDNTTDYVPPKSLVAMPALRTHSIIVMNEQNGQKNPALGDEQRWVTADQFHYRINSRRRLVVKLPQLAYRGYQVTVNSRVQTVAANQTGILRAEVQRGENTITVAYVPTAIQRVSAWISAVSWLLLLGWLGTRKWRKRCRKEATLAKSATHG